ncbi:MAG: prepilin-type N-terminal cleavage/methylation domain-containing protein [Acidiferrobacteraceae bacterium]
MNAPGRSTAATQRRLQAGFTLIELVIVIVLAGILAVAAMDRLPGAGLSLGAQTDQVASDLRLVQSLELTRGASYCLNVMPGGYQITDQGCATAIVNPATGVTTTNFGPGITASTNFTNGYVAFRGPGVPYASQTTALGAPGVITLSAGGASRTVSIAPQTGYVSVQ